MFGGAVIVPALLSMAAAPAQSDTGALAQASVAAPAIATSAPADSSAMWRWVRKVGDMDARLVPGTITLHDDTLPRRRQHAVEYSEWYYRRLQIHRWGSWAELPVFATEYWLGNKLISNREDPASWVKPTHAAVAGVLGGLFTVNTLTGAWNLYDSRNSTDDRALVWSHSALMLAADAGFALTGMLAGDEGERNGNANRHRNVALASMGIATAGTLLMWVKRGL